MILIKLTLSVITCIIALLFDAQNALAWGPGVHTAIALGSLDGAGFILPSIAKVITAFPIEYLYGALSADFFIGKGKRKRRNPHDWEGGFQFLNQSTDDCEKAYAWGFLSHLAADVIAHNYYIPNLISAYPGKGNMGHLFWELRADYVVGPGYTRIAKGVLAMDHQVCDNLLKLIGGKRKKGLGTKKRFYTQTVRFSDYLYTTRDLFFEPKAFRREVFNNYLAVMVDISCRLSKDFLTHPDSSPGLLHDPMGRENLLLANKKGAFRRLFAPHRPIHRFDVNKDLLSV
ncbi:MAG: zinc dependent phospholipase C family protein [Deltaproteobacteria bacterium]|nr:zinc dependent phospholipase C family protein [Deltaproteobacteria bacterium]